MAVFAFRVALSIKSYPDGKTPYLLGYHGLIYADPEEGLSTRLEVHDDPPSAYPFKDSGWDVDYGHVTISGRQLFLPVKALTHLRRGKLLSRSEIQFTNYRKYEAASTVRFGGND
jgi:hypothetical protein